MRLAYLTRAYHLNAAHRLFDPERDDAWNERVYGKCSHPDGHGHNYELEITLRGVPHPESGMIFPVDVLDARVEELVLSRFDHRSLNRRLELDLAAAPTSEVFIVEIWNLLAAGLELDAGNGEHVATTTRPELWRIQLQETPRNVFEYRGPAPSAAGDHSPSK